MKEIDARGLACPAPVLQTKAALQEEDLASLRVVLDNAASQQNVQRFLESQGYATELEAEGEDVRVVGTRGDAPRPAEDQGPAPEAGGQPHAVSAFESVDDPHYQTILGWIEAGVYR